MEIARPVMNDLCCLQLLICLERDFGRFVDKGYLFPLPVPCRVSEVHIRQVHEPKAVIGYFFK